MAEQEWIAAGLLDPAAPGAEVRRALLVWLEEQGCTMPDLVAAHARGSLASAAGDRRLRPRPTLSREQVAERVGIGVEDVDRATLASGFPPSPPGEPAFTEDDLALFGVFPAASMLFGPDTLLAFVRVMAASMARIAEAADSMFLADVEAPRREGGATELDLARDIDDAVTLLSGLPDVLAPLFRRHASAAIERSRLARSDTGDGFRGPDRVRTAVAFVDLVGYTGLAERHDPRTLARAVGRFERAASERAVAAGARVVKSIGDAVMIVGHDPLALVDVAGGLLDDVAADPDLGRARAAVVVGDVLARDGDYVGATVNLAARATKEADPGGVVVNEPVADALAAAGRATVALEARLLRGIDDPVVLHAVADR